MKNAFIIHGFNGDTTGTFGPYLKEEFEKRNYERIYCKNLTKFNITYKIRSILLDDFSFQA